MNEECRAGCCPHNGSRPGEGCPGDLPAAPLRERVGHLRGCQLMPVQKIAALTGADRRLITRLLYEAPAAPGPGGARRAGVRRGPSEAELLAALYADQDVRRALDRHRVPVVGGGGAAWRRFPASQPLTANLVCDLYEGCGLGLHHIELLTGRPAAAAGAVLRASGIKLRAPGSRAPFTDRSRPGRE